MDEDIGEFLSDNMQQRTKNHEKERSSLRTLKVNILICNVLVFFKKLLCGLRSSCLRLNVNRCNCVKRDAGRSIIWGIVKTIDFKILISISKEIN